MATQQGDREHQDRNKNHEQRELNHGSVKNTCALGGPSWFPGEGSHLQADDKNAPYRGDQSDDEEGLHGEKNVRADRDANGVQNLHKHENDQQLVEHTERFGSDGPVNEPFPKHVSGTGDARRGGGRYESTDKAANGPFRFSKAVADPAVPRRS